MYRKRSICWCVSLGCGGRRSEHCRKCGVMIPQRGSCWCVWPVTSHSQISHPHAVSSWPICQFHPLPHSLSHALSASEHTRRQSSCGVDSPRVLFETLNFFLQFSRKNSSFVFLSLSEFFLAIFFPCPSSR